MTFFLLNIISVICLLLPHLTIQCLNFTKTLGGNATLGNSFFKNLNC